MIIDVWDQHPTLRHSQDPIFDSLRRWAKTASPSEPMQISVTLAAMDQGGVDRMLIGAWIAPRNIDCSTAKLLVYLGEQHQ